MNAAQLTVFKAAILADGNVSAFVSAQNHIAIAAYYNGAGTGNIWRPDIKVSEINTALVGSEFVALTAIKQNLFLVIASAPVDATSANVRANFTAIFTSGTTLSNLTALAQRVPTKGEMVFTTSNVCSMYGLIVSANDVAQALGS